MQEILRNRLTVIPLKYESSKPIYLSKTTNHEYEESSLYFVERKSNLIETTDYNVTETIVTIIFMSFTNIDISITLPGGGLTMKGPW
jgi:hypothetical protein